MNILFLTEFFPDEDDLTGGVETRVYHLAQALSSDNKVYVLASRRPGQKDEEVGNIHLIRIGPEYPYTNYGYLFQRILFSIILFFSISKLVKKFSIDVVDASTYFTYPVIIRNIPVLVTYHEVWIGSWVKNTRSFFGVVGEVFERLLMLMIRIKKIKIIAVSEYTRKKLLNHGIKEINVIPNGIPLHKYAHLKVKKDETKICTVSRLIPQKRVDDIIYALSIAGKKHKLHLVVIGQGEENEKLKALANKLRVNVQFLGHLASHEEVIKEIKGSKLYVSASIREGFGIVLLESAACGVPFVCSDIEPFIEVSKGKAGLFFRNKNHYDLADKIGTLIKDKLQYKKKVRESLELASKYDWLHISESLLKVYSLSIKRN
jgi:glycosyltransferase involved in cell wall biosynthesis